MCEPTLIITAIGAAASLKAQSDNAAAQAAHQNNLMIQRQQEMEVNQILANRAAADEQAQVNDQIAEKQIGTSQTLTDNAIKAAEAIAAQKVSSGEAGVSGISIAALQNDFVRKEARFADSVRQNQEGFEKNAKNQKDAIESKRQGRIASVQPYIPKPVTGPDYASAFVKVAGAGYDAYKAGAFSKD